MMNGSRHNMAEDLTMATANERLHKEIVINLSMYKLMTKLPSSYFFISPDCAFQALMIPGKGFVIPMGFHVDSGSYSENVSDGLLFVSMGGVLMLHCALLSLDDGQKDVTVQSPLKHLQPPGCVPDVHVRLMKDNIVGLIEDGNAGVASEINIAFLILILTTDYPTIDPDINMVIIDRGHAWKHKNTDEFNVEIEKHIPDELYAAMMTVNRKNHTNG
jgi:hypothetical protein